MKQPHHRGPFDRRGRALRAAAYADPDTRCRRCGHRLHEGPEHKPADVIDQRDGKPYERWEAGHLIDGEVDGLLVPETRSCNRRAAARKTNAKRSRRRVVDVHSREW